jgi:hypothetical protein
MHARSSYSDTISKQPSHAQSPQHRFRAHFTRELTRSVGSRGSLEESFGQVFEETLNCIPISEDDQGVLYRELLMWAKKSTLLFSTIHSSYSPAKSKEIGSSPAII